VASTAPVDPFSGLYGVTVTPFTSDGEQIDEHGIRRLVGYLLADGVDRIVPNGNTGEYHALTADERRRVVELTAEAGAGRIRLLVVGVGGAIPDAVAASRHAADVGADAVMVHHPSHPHVTGDGLIAYYGRIAEASPIPIIPYLKAILDDATVRRMAALPGVEAVKWGINDLPAFGRAVTIAAEAGSKVRWICGTAETWAPFYWAAGAVGFTSGLVNVTARLSFELLHALEAGDRARAMEVWAQVRPFEQLRSRAGDAWNVAIVKEAMHQVGRPAGPVRAPSSAVSAEDAAAIAELLAGWGATATAPAPVPATSKSR
jgi:4-hydroxy-tetrahydrodipicolinate synthase